MYVYIYIYNVTGRKIKTDKKGTEDKRKQGQKI